MAHYAPTRQLRVGTIQAGRGYPYTIPRCFFRNQPLLAVGDNPLGGAYGVGFGKNTGVFYAYLCPQTLCISRGD